jgi:carboxyl-terminal processing protease
MVRRGAWIAGGFAALGAVCLWGARGAREGTVVVPIPLPTMSPAGSSNELSEPSKSGVSGLDDGVQPAAQAGLTGTGADDARTHSFRIPSGQPPSLGCAAARAIVLQAREQLGYSPEPVDPRTLADATADWLDPYGLWSVAPDAPLEALFDRRAASLIADLEARTSGDCKAAHGLGVALVGWVGELRSAFDAARVSAPVTEDPLATASSAAFEGATVTRPARVLAATLGRRVGAFERSMGPAGTAYGDAARSRYFPPLDANGWAGVVLAAAVRAYVPALDPHGAWAPLDEESSVYEVDLEAHPPQRLWDKAERTAIGVKLESGAAPPLADGDVVLSLAGVPTAGLSYEQIEQLGYAASDTRPAARIELLRHGEKGVVTAWLDGPDSDAAGPGGSGDESDADLPVERIAYGEGDVVVVAIHDVRDDLGDELTRALLHERQREDARPIVGVVLDLRGNGGGSTDGAIDALGLFIPGAALFPMKRRDGSLETDRAPEPPGVDRWRGPVAAFVDGDTASAAEMIAGALASYRRGPSVGMRTFGKGCAQEYLDDDAHAGVLRLTTLLYALPDGTPVQRVGLAPTIRVSFGAFEANDREAALPHAPPLWRGPDVRDRQILAHAEDGTWSVAWPAHGGSVGPCHDADVCRALRVMGATPATARRTAAPKGR